MVALKYEYMKDLLQQRFFQLLSEYSQCKVSEIEFTEAIEELATHVADFSINELHYMLISGKVYYRASDVRQFIKERFNTTTLRNFEKQFGEKK